MYQFNSTRHSIVAILFLIAARAAYAQESAQQPPQPGKDVLVLVDGERLVGQFELSSGSSVTFRSDLVGEVTLDWSKVQEFHSPKTFAIIPKEAAVERHADTSAIPQGAIA